MSAFSYFNALSILKCLPVISLLTLSFNSQAESIQQWPNIDGIDTAIATDVFVNTFKDNPRSLAHLAQGFQTCEISAKKLAKLSNINEDAIKSVFDRHTKVSIDLDIAEMTLASTPKGCIALQEDVLEPVPNSKYKHYQVSSNFSYSFYIFADYQSKMNITSEINGKEYKTNTVSDNKTHLFYSFLDNPFISTYPKTLYNISEVETSGISITTHALYLTSNNNSLAKFNSIALSRSYQDGKISNSLVTTTNNLQGSQDIQIIGNHTYMQMLDGKIHGLMVTDNYLYATDKSQEQYSHSCYDQGKRVNVFKKIPPYVCIEVSDNQIGNQDVYVDSIYKIQLDSKQQVATLRDSQKNTTKNKTLSLTAHQEKQVLAQKKADEAAFKQKLDQAKCDLKSTNWAYLGDQCLDGLAHGEGSSVDRQGLTFIGTFKAGERVTGDIEQNGDMIFSGDFKKDKPDGSAICFFEGEYEECRFFRGKRIDTLYKIRKENAKNLAKIEQIQAEQQANQHSRSQQQNNNGQSNIVVDAIKKEGAKKAASFIFDQLF